MLLQSEDLETPNILDPETEFIQFKEHFSWEGLGKIGMCESGTFLAKVLDYAYGRRDLAARIAAAGSIKGKEKLDGREFFRQVFELIGLRAEEG